MTIPPHDHDHDIADHLGDELDAAGRRRLAEARAQDSALDAELQHLESTVSALRRLDAPAMHVFSDAVGMREAGGAEPVAAGESRRVRYAAVAAIAFAAGVLAHAWLGSSGGSVEGTEDTEDGTPRNVARSDPGAAGRFVDGADPGRGLGASDRFDDAEAPEASRRFAAAWTAQADRRGLARGLLALSHATNEPIPPAASD